MQVHAPPYSWSYAHSSGDQVEVLDLLHVVYALTMKILGIDVAAFIIDDKDFERARDLFKRWGIKLVILQAA